MRPRNTKEFFFTSLLSWHRFPRLLSPTAGVSPSITSQAMTRFDSCQQQHLPLPARSPHAFQIPCHALYLAGMDPHVDSCAVRLLPLNTFNVDDVFLPVHLDHLANLLSFVVSPHNLSTTQEASLTITTSTYPNKKPKLHRLKSQLCSSYTRATKTSINGQFQQLLKWKNIMCSLYVPCH